MLFGSELGMLVWLADRNDIAVEDKAYETSPYAWYTVDTEQETLGVSEGFPIEKPATYAGGTGGSYYYGNSGYYSRHHGDDDGEWPASRYTSSSDTRYASIKSAVLALSTKTTDLLGAPVLATPTADPVTAARTRATTLSTEEAKALGKANVTWYEKRGGVSPGEELEARNMGAFEDIVQFCPDEWKPDESILSGYVIGYDLIKDQWACAHMPGLKNDDVPPDYQDRHSFGVLVGIRYKEHVIGGERCQYEELILAPLTDEGYLFLLDDIEKKAAA